MGETALQQFSTRVRRVLGEYFPQHAPNPYKYVSEANVNVLAYKFDLSGFLPSDAMVKREAEIQIQAGNIRETAAWCEAFAGFHQATGDAYRLDCNIPILEKALQGRCPTAELLMQIASEKAAQLQMTATATAQAERDQKHEALFHELAPRLITDIPAGSNRYAVALDNKRIEAERQRIWDLSLEELEALKTKKNLRSMSKEELKKIVNDAEPARREQMVFGNRHADAVPEQIMTLRERAAEQVKMGIYRPIPLEFQIPGKEISVPFSFSLLRQLPKEIVSRLMTMYGDTQLTMRCQEFKFSKRNSQ
jgi:hypothetical protein